MFQIENGRSQFFQWDTKQRLIVEDASIEQVHFCNRTDDCSLKREVYNENGKRIVNVPDILLQDDWRIHVYAWDNNYTKYEEVFEVEKRTKPPTYVYTEEEITEYAALEARIDEVEQNGISDARLEESIAAYIAENPIEGGASLEQAAQIDANTSSIAAIQKDYATKEYVDDAVATSGGGGGGGNAAPDVVYFTMNSDLTLNGTHEEVKAVIDNGKLPLLIANINNDGITHQYIFHYYTMVDEAIAFSAVIDGGMIVIGILPDNTINTDTFEFLTSDNFTTIANEKGYLSNTQIANIYITQQEVEESGFLTADEVQSMIDTSLGVIENGTY